jgi:hypothetical protein
VPKNSCAQAIVSVRSAQYSTAEKRTLFIMLSNVESGFEQKYGNDHDDSCLAGGSGRAARSLDLHRYRTHSARDSVLYAGPGEVFIPFNELKTISWSVSKTAPPENDCSPNTWHAVLSKSLVRSRPLSGRPNHREPILAQSLTVGHAISRERRRSTARPGHIASIISDPAHR